MKPVKQLAFAVSGAFGLILFSCTGNIPADRNNMEACNNIREYLINESKEITGSSLAGIRTLQDWENIRSESHSEFIEMMSLQDMPLKDNRSELNVKITGTIQKEGYRIEKLHYESLPGLFVPANLYVPDNITVPVPAILYVCGHSHTQKVHYQTHPAKFARLGFVCLIIETIQYGEVWGEHWGCYAKGWFHWYSRGYTPAGVEAWNAIRGLDLLAGRPEVDAEKMGVTGISGGGSQSWFIAAADQRVRAVAPVCGASTLEAQITTRTIDGHCDCMVPVNTYNKDFHEIGALIAPRPLLICQADRDGLNRVESVHEIYTGIKRIYELYGAPENIGYVETPGGHSYHKISREKIFSFFLNHLMGQNISPEEAGDIDQTPENLLSEEALKVYVDGPPDYDRTKTIQDSFIRLAGTPEIKDEAGLTAMRDSVKKFLLKKTFNAFPENPCPLDPKLVFRTLDRAGFGSDIYSFVSEKGWRLKIDLHWRNEPSVKKPLMIVLKSPGENRRESEGFISGLKGEWNLAFLEVRGVGEFGWSPELQWHVRRASAWTGRTIASMQVYDLLRCIEFCRILEGVDPDNIGIAARDEMGVVALYAALLDGRCKTLILKDPPETQDTASNPDGRGAAIEMLNCLRITDVYQLPALLAPADILFLGKMPEAYKWSEKILVMLGKKSITIADKL